MTNHLDEWRKIVDRRLGSRFTREAIEALIDAKLAEPAPAKVGEAERELHDVLGRANKLHERAVAAEERAKAAEAKVMQLENALEDEHSRTVSVEAENARLRKLCNDMEADMMGYATETAQLETREVRLRTEVGVLASEIEATSEPAPFEPDWWRRYRDELAARLRGVLASKADGGGEAERRQGHSKLVYDKAMRTIVSVDPAPADGGTDCEDCGRRYGNEHGFPDLVVPLDVWKRISTNGDETGLLCPSCLCGRLHKAGITCEAAFMSGPIESVSRPTMYALRRIENLEIEVARDRLAEQKP